MLKTVLATALALALVGIAAPAAAAPPECVQYMYIDDYHWYYVCANPKDTSCPVYTKEQHGATVTERCVTFETTTGLPGATCVPTSGGMDYHSYACVDASNPKCAVYTLTSSDWGTQKRCFGVLG